MSALIKKIVLFVVLSMSLTFVAPVQSTAQCPMCKLSAEQNLKDGGTAGKGLNKGILYMLLTPYLVIGSIGYFWYRNRVKTADEE